jgi:hypothetical protein
VFNLARLFAYTRRLEDDLRAARNSLGLELARSEDRHLVEIERVRDQHVGEIDFLREELQASRGERQFLQDRWLQRGGMNPIFEPSPGEIASRATVSSDKKEVLSPRQRVQHRGQQAHAEMRAEIDKERDAFLEEQKAKDSATPQAAS